ncbi:MAG: hypothetical protein ACRD15_18315 [Vicinamibacterales bacterium]
MTVRTTAVGIVALVTVLSLSGTAELRAQEMPNPRQMSGVPLPVGDVPPGTVTVRVIRGSFANPVSSLTVEIVGAPTPMHATTNDVGRAEFSGLAAGARVKARATVGGERLESQEFAVPPTGGIRLMLVAADPGAGAATEPAQPPAQSGAGSDPAAKAGQVTLGDQSRFVFEMGEDGLSVFYVLQIVNATESAVQPDAPLVFELPASAKGATILQGSSPQASVAGREMTVAGPFAPGPTLVQLAYTMPISGPELVIEQALPTTLAHLAVVAQKVGELQLASPQLSEQRTMPAQGNLYIAGRGGPVQAGEVLRFTFTGMPHHSTWPRNLAIALALLLLAGGAWSAARPGVVRTEQAEQRRQLEADRDRLFDELAALETRNSQQGIDPERHAARRRELVSALERVYAALDEEVPVGRAS